MSAQVGLLLGQTTPAKAARMAERYAPCPYCVSFTHVGGTIIALFAIPPEHHWWLEGIEERPQETLGLDSAEVFFGRQIQAESPWSRGEVQPTANQTPCGSDCRTCPAYVNLCPGCPATRYYRET